jgi:hypothetical protein
MEASTTVRSNASGTAPGSESAARERMGASRGSGWLAYAGIMLVTAAAFNTLYGVAALVNDDYFVADELLFGDLAMWGAFYLCVAAIQAITAGLVFTGSPVGAFFGIVIAVLSATVALMSIGAYPVWSVVILVVDGLIIYGLSVYGFGAEESR